jgi:epoxyqueuosine reductase QueG
MMHKNVQVAASTVDIKEFCLQRGAAMVGVADLYPLKEGLQTEPPDLMQSYTAAISIAIPLNMNSTAAMRGDPTPEYASNCKDINTRLDSITRAVVEHIENMGYRAEAVPASKKLIEGGTEGSVSHKAIAIMAGLGWQGKSLLLVTSKYGPRIRLSSVLTDMPLEFDSPVKNRCGKCIKCTEACPVGAIRNVNTDFHYSNRDEALDLDKCHKNTLKYMKVPGVEYTFCGQCIPVCPHGRKLMLREAGLEE